MRMISIESGFYITLIEDVSTSATEYIVFMLPALLPPDLHAAPRKQDCP